MKQIDIAKLRDAQLRLGRAPRVLDIACGTGSLLLWLIQNIPDAEAYGVDASVDMLAQARALLHTYPNVRLTQAIVGTGETAHLPYAPETFDLITCTNAFHELADPVGTLQGIANLLTPEGQLVLEDYAWRPSFWLWPVVEWLARRVEEGHVRAYTVDEAEKICSQAGLSVIRKATFVVNWLWHGWTLYLQKNKDVYDR
jgi:ubiquinone/menaquinone biosynthesis C-methylase UbiE